MRAGAPTSGRSRPPSKSAAGHVGAPARPTVRVRPTVPIRHDKRRARYDPSDPYVRRFWVAALGAGAVAELLRLIRAAGMGEEVRLPRNLPALLRADLVRVENGTLLVSKNLPVVPIELRWRFTPSLAAEHNRAIGG